MQEPNLGRLRIGGRGATQKSRRAARTMRSVAENNALPAPGGNETSIGEVLMRTAFRTLRQRPAPPGPHFPPPPRGAPPGSSETCATGSAIGGGGGEKKFSKILRRWDEQKEVFGENAPSKLCVIPLVSAVPRRLGWSGQARSQQTYRLFVFKHAKGYTRFESKLSAGESP